MRTALPLERLHQDLGIPSDVMVPLPTRGVVCDGKRAYIGVCTFHEAPVRNFIYALCGRCAAKPGIEECVESIIEARLARGDKHEVMNIGNRSGDQHR